MADFYGGNELIYDIQSGSIMAGGYKIESASMMQQFEGGSKDGKDDINLSCNVVFLSFNLFICSDNRFISLSKFIHSFISCSKLINLI